MTTLFPVHITDEELGGQVRAHYSEAALQYLESHHDEIVDEIRAYPTSAFSQIQDEVGAHQELEGPDREEYEIREVAGDELSDVVGACHFDSGRVSVLYSLHLNSNENYNFQSEDGDSTMTAHATYWLPFEIKISFAGESADDADHELGEPSDRCEDLVVLTSRV